MHENLCLVSLMFDVVISVLHDWLDSRFLILNIIYCTVLMDLLNFVSQKIAQKSSSKVFLNIGRFFL
jgi:hypothetical protein